MVHFSVGRCKKKCLSCCIVDRYKLTFKIETKNVNSVSSNCQLNLISEVNNKLKFEKVFKICN